MRYAAYPSYKASGIEWLGEVPEHWDILPLRRRLRGIKDGTHGSFERVSDGVPLLSAKNVSAGKVFISETESMISRDDWAEITRNGFPKKGDVLLTIVGTIGRSAVFDSGEPVAFQRSVAFLRFRGDQNPHFIRYALDSAVFQAQLQSYTNAAAQGGTYMGDVIGIPLAFPSAPEQRAIADFLDAETGKLDTLIAKNRELIERLKEKRTALISRTVTRGLPTEAARAAGLNPHLNLKPSGIEGLGDVPEHWEVKKVRHLARLKSGENITSDQLENEGAFPVFGGNGLRGYSSRFTHQGHYILIGRQGALCGNVNYASGQFWASEHAIVVSPLTEFATVWLGELLRSMNLNQYSISAAQPGLSVEMISGLKIPVPPLPEQRAIADYLDQETGKIDRMVAKEEAVIERLQEYRTAVITAAVTGKIDVRNVRHSGAGRNPGVDEGDGYRLPPV